MLAAVPRVLALLKTHLEATHDGLAERAAEIAAQKLGRCGAGGASARCIANSGSSSGRSFRGGGALPGPLEQFWNALGFVLVQGYGMTETTALITLNHPFHVAEGTIGKPLPGREVKLGPDGEVLVRGRGHLRRHLGRTERCARARTSGWRRATLPSGRSPASSSSWAGRAK